MGFAVKSEVCQEVHFCRESNVLQCVKHVTQLGILAVDMICCRLYMDFSSFEVWNLEIGGQAVCAGRQGKL